MLKDGHTRQAAARATLRRLKALPPAIAARDAVRELRTFWRVARPLLTSTALRPLGDEPDIVSRFSVPAAARLEDLEEFCRWLANKTDPPQGADSLYLSPRDWMNGPLFCISECYPSGCGLKISKSVGDVRTPYMSMRSGRRLQRQLAGSHSAQVRTYNYLHLRGIAPRLWDIVELIDGRGAVRVAYVVEHVEGNSPNRVEFDQVVTQLRELCAKDDAVLVSGSGWRGVDFQLPDGNGNVITALRDGRAKYIDVHSFKVLTPDMAFGKMCGQAELRGDPARQSGPPPLARRADPSGLARMLRSVGRSFTGKLVLDTTGRFNPAVLDCLREGAAWVHAWLKADEIARAERILLEAGLTRASFSMAPILGSGPAETPPHLQRFSDHKILVRSSSGGLSSWRTDFSHLPWTTLFFEHAEGEDLRRAMRVLGASRRLGQDDHAALDKSLGRVALLDRAD